eukprot:scaffold23772_cov63-Phaeocystis_antarctica.AAC.4
MHSLPPKKGWYVPAGHSRHPVPIAPPGLWVPFEHGTHSPFAPHDPAGHSATTSGGHGGGGNEGGGGGESTSGSGEAASERRCFSAWPAASRSELASGVSTRPVSARWSRNGAASLRSTTVAAQSA